MVTEYWVGNAEMQTTTLMVLSHDNVLVPLGITSYLYLAVLLCWVTPDFELYAAFDPLADKVLLFIFSFKLVICLSDIPSVTSIFRVPF